MRSCTISPSGLHRPLHVHFLMLLYIVTKFMKDVNLKTFHTTQLEQHNCLDLHLPFGAMTLG